MTGGLRYGTAYFATLTAAARYYGDKVTAQRKLEAGEIFIGPPPTKPGDRYGLDDDRRYWVETPDNPPAG